MGFVNNMLQLEEKVETDKQVTQRPIRKKGKSSKKKFAKTKRKFK